MDQVEQCGKVPNQRGHIMLIGRGNGIVDGFLKTSETLIELQQLSNGRICLQQLARPRNAKVPGRLQSFTPGQNSLLEIRERSSLFTFSYQRRWCALAQLIGTCPQRMPCKPPETKTTPMYTWMRKAPIVNSAAVQCRNITTGMRPCALSETSSGNHISTPVTISTSVL